MTQVYGVDIVDDDGDGDDQMAHQDGNQITRQRHIIFGFVLILIKFRLTAQTKRSVT